jgi:hypothetical protein
MMCMNTKDCHVHLELPLWNFGRLVQTKLFLSFHKRDSLVCSISISFLKMSFIIFLLRSFHRHSAHAKFLSANYNTGPTDPNVHPLMSLAGLEVMIIEFYWPTFVVTITQASDEKTKLIIRVIFLP